MQVRHGDDVIGASLEGIDLAQDLDDALFADIAAVFHERGVVCIKHQTLEPEHLLGFARRFGTPDQHFMTHYALPDHPNVMRVSNIQEDGRDIGFADAGRVWHSDGSYMQTPVAVSMLYAIEVPTENGRALGDTQFASAAAAYDGLDDALKARIEGLESVHQVAGRRASTGTGLKDRAQEQAQPEAIHPLVRTHPVTGRRYLFATQGECSGVIGMDESEGLALIDTLACEIQREAYRHVHSWEVGDLLVWDNRAVQHLATFDYHWPQHRRLMHRVTVTEGA